MDNFKPPETPDSIPPPPTPGTFPPGHQPYYAPPPPEEMGTRKVVGLSALACCIPLVGPVIALIIGIIERAKNGATVVIVIGGIMLVLSVPILGVYAAVALPLLMMSAPESVQDEFFEALGGEFSDIQDKSKEAEVKQNLHMIQLNLERYLVDRDGVYPDSIEQVIQADSFFEFPTNPFSYSPMLEVNLTDPPETKQGNFTYLPESTGGKVTGYTLLGYGSLNTTDSFYPGGEGPAAVVVTLSGGIVSDTKTPEDNQQ